MATIIFIIIGLSLFGLLNFYILKRGWRALAGTGSLRVVLLIAFLFMAACFVAGRTLVIRFPGAFSEAVAVTGYVYLALINFLFWIVLFIDLLRLINAFFPFFPRFVRENPQQAGHVTAAAAGGTVILLLAVGLINAAHPRLRRLEITVPKDGGPVQTLRIAVFSDFHLSPIQKTDRLENVVRRVAALEPDLLLVPGDMLNEDTPLAELERMTTVFAGLRPKFGMYFCEGNHEHYHGLERNLAYLRKSGLTILQDERVLVADSFYILGRRDRAALRPMETRRSIKEILDGADKRRPIILLDHQPIRLEEAQENGVDLQVSGHTHGGQIFPFTLINKLIYEIDQGYGRKGGTHYDVTTGVGNWGPPLRIGSRSEIVQIDVRFGK